MRERLDISLWICIREKGNFLLTFDFYFVDILDIDTFDFHDIDNDNMLDKLKNKKNTINWLIFLFSMNLDRHLYVLNQMEKWYHYDSYRFHRWILALNITDIVKHVHVNSLQLVRAPLLNHLISSTKQFLHSISSKLSSDYFE